ncbi:MAG: hypothetical protein MHMPM18_002332 [Marteilia pararefringens]
MAMIQHISGATIKALKAYFAELKAQQGKLVGATYTSSGGWIFMTIAMALIMAMALADLILVLIRYCFNFNRPNTNHTLELLKIAFCDQAYRVYNAASNSKWLTERYVNREIFQKHMFNRFYETIRNVNQEKEQKNQAVVPKKEAAVAHSRQKESSRSISEASLQTDGANAQSPSYSTSTVNSLIDYSETSKLTANPVSSSNGTGRGN